MKKINNIYIMKNNINNKISKIKVKNNKMNKKKKGKRISLKNL